MPSGLVTIAKKEFSETLRSKRFFIVIILFVALWAFISASTSIVRGMSRAMGGMGFFGGVGSGLASAMVFVAPILGIALGYAAISGEREVGSLKLMLARPIHREDVITGKAFAGIAAAGVAMFASTLIAAGGGVWLQGVTLTLDGVTRLLTFTLLSLMLFAAYYTICLFFSTLFTKTSRSLLVAIFIWVLFSFIIPIAASLIASVTIGSPPVRPFEPGATQPGMNATQPGQPGMSEDLREYSRRVAEISGSIQRFSINTHYSTVANAVLVAQRQIGGQPGASTATVTIGQALTTNWTSLAVLVAFTAVFFVLSYLAFTRREER